jgi:hypothetical protein
MASRDDPTFLLVLAGIAVAYFAFSQISFVIQKKIEDKAKKLSDDLFSQRHAYWQFAR